MKQLLNEIKQAAGKVPRRSARRAAAAATARSSTYARSPQTTRSSRYSGPSQGMGTINSAPVALSRRVFTAQPSIKANAKSCRIAHRELVDASVPGSTTFTVQNTLQINPGLAATFPWLAPQAQQWEQYVCHRCAVIWVPIAPTSTAGDVMISPEYDASETVPTTETQLSDNADTVVDSCWNSIVCNLDPSSMRGIGLRHYVRPCAVAGDIKTFDVAKVFIATNNETGTSAIGKLYLDYDFEFFKPQSSPSPATAPTQTSMFGLSGSQSYATTVAELVDFATTVYDPLNFGPAVAGLFTPPAGTYKIQSNVSYTDSAGETLTATISIHKNGTIVAHTGSQQAYLNVATGGGTITTFGIVPLNGTDTVSISLTLVGAAGTLALTASQSVLLISLA
jgi:hypothetical protein